MGLINNRGLACVGKIDLFRSKRDLLAVTGLFLALFCKERGGGGKEYWSNKQWGTSMCW
jgi:hypothetical protein